ncbi:MAG: hypothetical protein KF746_16725 [Chitinophagaceae bacterium]|nr:hypothetical protein [Chitinophagaceae bacterium]MBX3253671.1 hypothetical protein [Chitinophagaceae bacterium]
MKLFFATLLFMMSFPFAYSQIQVSRSGRDKIIVSNLSDASKDIFVGKRAPFILGPHSSRQVDFTLSRSNVKNTTVSAIYDIAAQSFDSVLCVNDAVREKFLMERVHVLIGLAEALFAERMRFELFIISLRIVAGAFGLPTANLDSFINGMIEIWKKDLTQDIKLVRMKGLIKSYFDRSNEISVAMDICIERTQEQLGRIRPTSINMSDYIKPQLKSFFQVSGFACTGTRVRMFKGVGDQKTIQRLDFFSQPSYGASISYVFNSYNRSGYRKAGIRNYIPLSFIQSSAVFKSAEDPIFSGMSQAYSWQLMSAGLGWSFEEYKRGGNFPTNALFFDAGIITGIMSKHGVTKGKIVERTSVGNIKDMALYVNAGYRYRIAGPVDLFGSWTSTIFHSGRKAANDLPNFFMFQFGLSIRFGSHFSYQY